MKWNSLKFKIPFTILIFSLSAIFMITMFIQNVTSKHIKEDVLKNNMVLSNVLSQHIQLYVKDAKETVITLANFATENGRDVKEIEKEIYRVYDNFKYFDLIYLLDAEGNMLISKPKNEKAMTKYNYSDRDYFKAVMKDKTPCISDLYVGRVLGQLHFVIAAPIFDGNKDVIGLIGGGINLSNIKEIIEEVQENFEGEIYIVDQTGAIIVHPQIAKIERFIKMKNYTFLQGDNEIQLYDVIKNRESQLLSYERNDAKYYSTTSFVDEVSWTIALEQSEYAILKEMIWLKKQLRSISFMIVFATIIIGLISSQKITVPIETLVKGVRALGDSYEKVTPISINSNDEIEELAEVFNDMSVKLKNNMNRLKESYNRENYFRQYLDNVLKSLGSGILVVNEKGNITLFNKAAEEITGFKSEVYLGKDYFDFFKKIEICLDNIVKNIRNNDDIITLERNLKRKDDTYIPVNISISLAFDEDKEIIGIIYLFNDISREKKIDKGLKKLDRMHILGELSAALIHDIGNPLAGISNLLELLDSNWEDDKLREDIFYFLDKEIKELNDLIVNFLTFSRDTSLNKEPINIVELMREVIKLLRPEIISKDIGLSENYLDEENAIVNINKGNIKQALINIIINCIQAIEEKGIMSITVKNYKTKVIISIKDNGKGIDKKDLDKIFEPFYTTKKEGTGLGLSSTYKTIKEHDGNIFINSEIDKGTEFIIELKK